jgi:UDP-2-acetamido-3-amino-2,3-dideoxy-glucuronate N-acetyltransferase
MSSAARRWCLPTLVKRGATIGANATIVCGSTLGRFSFVGAGAVVTRDVPDYAVVYGTPATIRSWACNCGLMLSFSEEPDGSESACCDCGKHYKKKDLHVQESESES